jgi:DNA-binding response OmpR family regulator
MQDPGVHTILAIDDNSVALFARKKVLEWAGYSVLTAPDPSEAWRMFSENRVDLVLMDYYLPGGSGELRRQMKAARPGLPIVVLSGAIDVPGDLRHTDLFLSKLEAPEAILTKIAQVLQAGNRRAA